MWNESSENSNSAPTVGCRLATCNSATTVGVDQRRSLRSEGKYVPGTIGIASSMVPTRASHVRVIPIAVGGALGAPLVSLRANQAGNDPDWRAR